MSPLLRFVRAGMPYPAVGKLFGMSATRIGQIARAHGYNARDRISIGDHARSTNRIKRAYLSAFGQAINGCDLSLRRPVSIPDWAKRAGLADDYRDHARAFNEHEAARHCRALLSEQRRLDALDASLRAGRGA